MGIIWQMKTGLLEAYLITLACQPQVDGNPSMVHSRSMVVSCLVMSLMIRDISGRWRQLNTSERLRTFKTKSCFSKVQMLSVLAIGQSFALHLNCLLEIRLKI